MDDDNERRDKPQDDRDEPRADGVKGGAADVPRGRPFRRRLGIGRYRPALRRAGLSANPAAGIKARTCCAALAPDPKPPCQP